MKLMNDVITQLIDPNLYFSRFSFLESDKEAINIKFEVNYKSILTYLYRKQKLQYYQI